MIKDQQSIKLDYEAARNDRYKNVKKTATYTDTDLMDVYLNWAYERKGREHLWDEYCDVRDSVPRGTNARIRRDRNQSPFIN